MPIRLQGDLTCDGCGKAATARGVMSMFDGISLWWDLPSGWELFSRGRGRVLIYCAPACRGKGLSGYPDQTGQPSTAPPSKFDPRTLDKIFELMRDSEGANADNVLSAIESVLMAWRVGTGNA